MLVNSLVAILDTGYREYEEEEEKEDEDEFDLTISEKAMMNYVLKIKMLNPMRGWDTAAQKR